MNARRRQKTFGYITKRISVKGMEGRGQLDGLLAKDDAEDKQTADMSWRIICAAVSLFVSLPI